jgi:hypothetical protein
MYRILTDIGCIDVTEDHSLIKNNGNEISPKDCKIGDELLHSLPNFDKKRYIDVNDAYTMGLLCNLNYKILNSPNRIIRIYLNLFEVVNLSKNE